MAATDTIDTKRARTPTGRAAAAHTRWSDRKQVLDGLAVGLPSLLALALCLYELTTRSLWLDEAATVAIASQHGSAFGSALAHDGGNMLGYYALLHVLIGWFGTSAFVIRLPSVLFATTTVAVTGALGLRLFNRRVAALSGLLTAVSLSLVYWGQDARGYAAMVAFVAASFLAYVALLQPDRDWRAWIAYVLLTTAAVYAGLEAALVIPAQLLTLSWQRHRWRSAVSAMAAVAACCVPLAVLAASRGSGQLFWVPRPSLRVLGQVVQALTSSGLQPSFYTSTGTALLILTLVVLIAGAGRALSTARRSGIESRGGPLLSISWLLVPGIVAVVESTFGQSIFQARYLLVSLPAVSLLIAWALLDQHLPRALVLTTATALIVLRALQLAPAYGVSSENWRGATSYVVGHTQVRDCIAFYPLDNRQAFRYYLTAPQAAPRPILPAAPWTRVRPFVEDYSTLAPSAVAALPASCGRVWLVASHEGRVGGPPVSRANFQRFMALTSGLRRLYPNVDKSTNFGALGVVTVTLYAR
jgi:4-amino-4-deoxy-L-arabinose transferase-like glycosyltransferase